jgi:uncharacterized protein with beta-barrel porin domain
MATEFSNSQLSNLAARMTALSFGARGLGIAGLYHLRSADSPLFAQTGGAATDTTAREQYSPWGGFINGSYGYGSKDPTSLEDAFDFDGSEITLGVDYRLASGVVLGGMFGATEQVIDFDEAASSISVVDGGVDADGSSFMVFALYQGERLSLSGSLGTQSMDYEVERKIEYPSFNPNTVSVNTLAISRPQADIGVATFNVGYAFSWNRLTIEPFFNVDYKDVTIDSFAEERSINRISNATQSRRFDLTVSEQSFESLVGSVGLRFQYVVTPRFGVIIPYWNVSAKRELEDQARTISAGYAALEGILGPSGRAFVVPTDPPDENYVTFSVGVSTIFRGGRQRQLDGPIAGGLTGFFQLQKISSFENYEDQMLAGGFRYEF